jgi:malonyl-CoA/methylmalonyl-CoA synthetase
MLTRWKSSERIAVYDDAAWSFAAIESGARRLAHVLRHQRLGHLAGARVAILVPPGAHFVMAFLGVLMAGGCTIVLSPLHPPAETQYFCEDGDVVAIVTSLGWMEKTVGLGRPVITMEAVLEREDTPLAIEYAPTDPALQLYTSGTTGKPKGAVHTHASLDVQQDLLAEAWGLSTGDVLLHVLPLHHMHGLCIALLSTLGAGGAARMLPSFDAKKVWDRLADATVFMAVPTIYAKLLAAFDEADDAARARWQTNARRLRLMTSGSAALPVTIGERVRSIHGKYPLERFGMTEVGVAFSNPLHGERRPGTVGKLLRTFEMKLDDDGALHLRGPSVFSGYYHREPQEGWFETGDTAAVDDGYVKILGRTSVDILKSGGYKLSALEIEEVFREHPAVGEVAVVGLPDETWGERVVACVIARSACSEEELRAFAREKLAGYKVPRTIAFVDDLPKNALGKVVKPELVKRLTSP